jgi:hypothetical protein
LGGSFDFIHSYIVFQHIPVPEGERIFEKLVSLLANDGIAAIHLTFEDTRPTLRRWASYFRSRSRIANSFANLMSGNRHPPIQMNCYSMNRIFAILQHNTCSIFKVDFTDHGGFIGAMIYFERRLSGQSSRQEDAYSGRNIARQPKGRWV